jgi:UDP-N-acetylglucosamine:LPS N-acetylglucosamine transferase
MSRTILIMAGGTGGHIFGFGVTLASLSSASTVKVLQPRQGRAGL